MIRREIFSIKKVVFKLRDSKVIDIMNPVPFKKRFINRTNIFYKMEQIIKSYQGKDTKNKKYVRSYTVK